MSCFLCVFLGGKHSRKILFPGECEISLHAVCAISLGYFYIVTHYTKMDKTLWAYSNKPSMLFVHPIWNRLKIRHIRVQLYIALKVYWLCYFRPKY